MGGEVSLLNHLCRPFNKRARYSTIVKYRCGVVRELTGKQRNRIFAYDRYMAILSEGTEVR